MSPFRSLRSLRSQILIYTILPLILALIGVSFGSIALHQRSMRDMVAQRDVWLATAVAARLNDDLVHRVQVLARVARGRSVNMDSEWAFDVGIAFLRRDGRAETLLGRANMTRPEVVALRDAVLVNSQRPATASFVEPGRGLVIALAVAGAEESSVLVGCFSAESLHLGELVSHFGAESHAFAFVVDAKGRVIFDREPSRVGLDASRELGVSEAVRGETGVVFARTKTGEEVVSYAPLSVLGWGLIIHRPGVDLSMPVLRYSLLAPLLVLVAAVASLSAIYFGLRRIVHPLRILGDQAGRLAWGDFQAIKVPVDGIGEIQDLQRALQEMAEQIHRYQAGVEDYIAVLTRTQEEERRRLARELHDETVQALIALSQRVRMLELVTQSCVMDGSAAGLQRVQERLRETSAMIDLALNDVRRLIRDLRPIYLEELGLVPALEALIESAKRDGVRVGLEVMGEEVRLSAEAELAVYRMAQESLNNALRHAEATEVGVRLDFAESGVTLTIEDNGCGFDAPEVPGDLAARGHFGLVGIHERATRLGGYLSIRSKPGCGTRVVAFIPAEAKREGT